MGDHGRCRADRAVGGRAVARPRVRAVFELLAEADGDLALSELATRSGLPLPTIHRIVRTLVASGYVRQLPSRRYGLGPRLIGLGDAASRMLGSWAQPQLAALVDAVGETANMAMLDGDAVVYVAQVPSRHSMRMFTEVGRRVPVHCTGVGKVLLAGLREADVRALLARTGMAAPTPHTITDPDALLVELDRCRQGYAVDDAEQELGAVALGVVVLGVGRHRRRAGVGDPVSRLGDVAAVEGSRACCARPPTRWARSCPGGSPGERAGGLPARVRRLRSSAVAGRAVGGGVADLDALRRAGPDPGRRRSGSGRRWPSWASRPTSCARSWSAPGSGPTRSAPATSSRAHPFAASLLTLGIGTAVGLVLLWRSPGPAAAPHRAVATALVVAGAVAVPLLVPALAGDVRAAGRCGGGRACGGRGLPGARPPVGAGRGILTRPVRVRS